MIILIIESFHDIWTSVVVILVESVVCIMLENLWDIL